MNTTVESWCIPKSASRWRTRCRRQHWSWKPNTITDLPRRRRQKGRSHSCFKSEPPFFEGIHGQSGIVNEMRGCGCTCRLLSIGCFRVNTSLCCWAAMVTHGYPWSASHVTLGCMVFTRAEHQRNKHTMFLQALNTKNTATFQGLARSFFCDTLRGKNDD